MDKIYDMIIIGGAFIFLHEEISLPKAIGVFSFWLNTMGFKELPRPGPPL